MLAKYIIAGIFGSLLLARAAFAADSSVMPGSIRVAHENISALYQGTWRASKIVGLNVYNVRNEHIGTIDDLLTHKDGRVEAAVLSVGGYLGIGTRLVAVSFDKIKLSDQPVYSGASNTSGPIPMPSTTTPGSTISPTVTPSTFKQTPWYPNHAVFNMSKDALTKMPEFKYSNK